MMTPDDKREEQTPVSTPAADTTETNTEAETNEQQPINPLDMYIGNAEQRISSLTDEIKALQERQTASSENLAKIQSNIDEARKNRTSLMGSIIEKQKPVYDENKERRLRGAAIINSLGDMLSAAVRGYHAYGKGGAGVVTKAPLSPAMEEVAKINEMQQKYLNEHKAWENLDLNWKMQQAEEDIAAAEALYTKEQAVQKQINDKIEALRQQGVKITDDVRAKIADFYMKQYQKAVDTESKKEYELWLRQNRLGQYAPKKGGGGGGGSKTIKQSDMAKYYERVHGEGAYEWTDLADEEKKQTNAKAEDDFATNVYAALVKEGANADDYIDKINALADFGYTAESLLEDFQGYAGTLAEFLDDTYETIQYALTIGIDER